MPAAQLANSCSRIAGHLAAQQVLDEAGLLPGGHPQDRQRLSRALVDPARRHLAGAGDAHLHAAGIGQVDDMVGHAELLAPARLAAGALIEVALLRAHDAHIALRQLLHAGVAVALAEAGLGPAPAMAAMDGAEVFQAQRLAQQRVDRHLFVAEAQGVLHRRVQARRHLAQRATSQFAH
jgi:hypothetical protein